MSLPNMSAVERANLREVVLCELDDVMELKSKLLQLRSQIESMKKEASLMDEKLIFLENNVSTVIEKYSFEEKSIESEIIIRKKRENLEKKARLFIKDFQDLFSE